MHQVVAKSPQMPEMLRSIATRVAELEADSRLSVQLDQDSLVALVAYTSDNNVDKSTNVYFAMNRALRNRRTDPATFRQWQGFLYFLLYVSGVVGCASLSFHKPSNFPSHCCFGFFFCADAPWRNCRRSSSQFIAVATRASTRRPSHASTLWDGRSSGALLAARPSASNPRNRS